MESVNLKIRPLNKADIISFRGESYDNSIRGIAIEKNGKLLAIAGVMHTSPLHAFSSVIDDDIKNYPRVVVKAVREFKEILHSYSSPIYAMRNGKEESSSRFLKYVGFVHVKDEVYRWLTQ